MPAPKKYPDELREPLRPFAGDWAGADLGAGRLLRRLPVAAVVAIPVLPPPLQLHGVGDDPQHRRLEPAELLAQAQAGTA